MNPVRYSEHVFEQNAQAPEVFRHMTNPEWCRRHRHSQTFPSECCKRSLFLTVLKTVEEQICVE